MSSRVVDPSAIMAHRILNPRTEKDVPKITLNYAERYVSALQLQATIEQNNKELNFFQMLAFKLMDEDDLCEDAKRIEICIAN